MKFYGCLHRYFASSQFLLSNKLSALFSRYTIIALLSFIIDIGLFAFFYYVLKQRVLTAMLMARIVSGTFNFYQNKFVVYRSLGKRAIWIEALGYASLAVVMFIISYSAIMWTHSQYRIGWLWLRVATDIVIFIANFLLQKILFACSKRWFGAIR